MSESIIAICIATYKRPQGLDRLLQSLQKLDSTDMRPHVIIADNDDAGTARQVVDRHTAPMPFPVTYIVEPARGLSSVRNRLVSEARLVGAEYIAFVDDDEWVEPDWLQHLVATIRRNNAVAVSGRQVHQFDPGVPRSIQLCYIQPEYPTDQPSRHFSTCNVLLSMDILNSFPGPFDERLNLSGGEDTLLATQIADNGGLIVRCNEAVTYEYVPSTRLSKRYILKRYFRTGGSNGKFFRWVNPRAATFYYYVKSAGITIVLGSLGLAGSVVRDRSTWLRHLGGISYGAGVLAGMITDRADLTDYRKIHGS